MLCCPQFDFLRPQHSLFHYFTSLVEQYTKVLLPKATTKEKIAKLAESKYAVLADARYAAEWARRSQEQSDAKKAEAEAERVAYARVDWSVLLHACALPSFCFVGSESGF